MQKEQMIEKLFAVGAHFGYAPSRRHPSAAPFIFGTKGGTELFDLEKTAAVLEEALSFVKTLAGGRKTVLFVGGKAEAKETIKRVAERLNQPYVASRWIGGTLTNFSEIRKRLNRLAELTQMREKGELQKFTKRERLLIDREIGVLEEMFGGIKGLQKAPDALVVVDPKKESGSVAEAKQLNIPVIALLNSDCDRSQITHAIPGNDASIETIQFILDEIGKAYEQNLGPAPAVEKQNGGN
ncbi:30S ribosomal protein S2 [Candidatus Adlerbacteria bacterium RIFCSPHIGHO2_12_FULL_53_18]|uniref:Small ribosomal subunit protein uS2 n=2 Tax=Parcubacteria group TaxID=1794811 RepID=A0A1F4XTK3_9BACT|nr:MAG: 30S ribosomal protein S2 [Candidatus Adlerbacteria bacterium RIFCSPHIGHO2_12_FULL_53_18]OGG51314.1 MAG: 30S ribosomal protein S2 [Candidatus Kaiserbacteria bacterium RIFCSPHIGHO2_01_FULL_54_36b]